jgi:hypothetical protein
MSTRKGTTRGWPIAERLAFFSKQDANGCLIWQGALNSCGYGRISIGGHGKCTTAHRAAWEAKRGPIPAGLHVLHHCDVPACINVEHLFLGTHQENMADMASKVRAAKKLTPDIVRKIKSASGSQAAVGAAYGVSQSTVYEIRKGDTWKHVK